MDLSVPGAFTTTAVACLRTGRNFVGFELNEKYHAIAQSRIADEEIALLLAEEDETATA